MLVRLCVLTGEHSNYSLIITIGSSLFTQFVLLKAFNINTLNFHQYFKDQLSSHQPSHMHNTRHRTNSNFNTPLFNHSTTQNFHLYQVLLFLYGTAYQIRLKIALPSLHPKKQIKRHLLASQSEHFFNYIAIYFSLSSSPNHF